MHKGKPKIFISHSWTNKPLVRQLEDKLRDASAEVWVDHNGIRGGDNLPDEIGKALEWCNILVLVWSKDASDSYWVKLEYTNAVSLQKKIIPCLLDKTPLPSILASNAYINILDTAQGFAELNRALNIVKAEPVSDKTDCQLEVYPDQQIEENLLASENPQQQSVQSIPNSGNEIVPLKVQHYTGYYNGHDFVNGVCRGCALSKVYSDYFKEYCPKAQYHYTGYYNGHDFVKGVCQKCALSKVYSDHTHERCYKAW
jgi:hypothetical protein